jgi:hypothetical protein
MVSGIEYRHQANNPHRHQNHAGGRRLLFYHGDSKLWPPESYLKGRGQWRFSSQDGWFGSVGEAAVFFPTPYFKIRSFLSRDGPDKLFGELNIRNQGYAKINGAAPNKIVVR